MGHFAAATAGYVFLLRHPTAGTYEFGRNTSPADRTEAFGRVPGGLCEVVHLIETDDAPRLEAELRRRYRPQRQAGGGFRLTEAAVRAIRATAVATYGARGGRDTRPGPQVPGIYVIRPPSALAARIERTAAALGTTGTGLVQRLVRNYLPAYEGTAAWAAGGRGPVGLGNPAGPAATADDEQPARPGGVVLTGAAGGGEGRRLTRVRGPRGIAPAAPAPRSPSPRPLGGGGGGRVTAGSSPFADPEPAAVAPQLVPDRGAACPACGSTDTWVYLDPDPRERPTFVCGDCLREAFNPAPERSG